MPGVRCARTWEAEAIEDGRLSNADRASFERHAATCETCEREARSLASLRRIMGEVGRKAPDALALRRQRAALLQAAQRPHPDRWVPWRRAIAILVLGAVGLTVTRIVTRSRAPFAGPPPTVATAAAPAFEVVDIDHAVVTSTIEGATIRAVMADGVAAFHVAHVQSGHRFLVALPDGEIEVRGTRFIVSVRGGRTQSVEVTEGLVALRLRGLDGERLLASGERWSLPASSSSPPAAASAASSLPPRPVQARNRAHRSALVQPAAAAASVQPAAARGPVQEQFEAAVSAFGAGRYGQADDLFAAFAQRFPGDPLGEDAAFLRAMCHARAGDSAGAAALARAYLRSFPNGLRRPEAEQLAGTH